MSMNVLQQKRVSNLAHTATEGIRNEHEYIENGRQLRVCYVYCIRFSVVDC
jgi:hypothetical protein